jgi:hypothetical protein
MHQKEGVQGWAPDGQCTIGQSDFWILKKLINESYEQHNQTVLAPNHWQMKPKKHLQGSFLRNKKGFYS